MPSDVQKPTSSSTSPSGVASVTTIAAIFLLFTTVFLGESLFSYTSKSATWDEPIHLADGYYSLFHGDYRYDPEHPPLARMLAALALAGRPISSDTGIIDRTTPETWATSAVFDDAHRFLYQANDADALLYRARFVIVLLGVGLGAVLFAWTRAWLGLIPAAAALAMVVVEPNLVAHFSLVTTDAPLVLFWVAALFSLWRTTRAPSRWTLAALCLCVAAAVTTKFTAILLYPILAVLLAASVLMFRRLSWRTALGTFAVVLVTSWVAIWGVYGFRYLPSESAQWQYRFHDKPYIVEREPTLSSVVGWIDDHRLLPNMYSQGFLLGQARADLRDAFVAGKYSNTGWWFYFPLALAIKTPLALLLLAGAGAIIALRRREQREMLLFVTVPVAGLLIPAMVSSINIGVRHVLAIQPFLILLAALAVSRLMDLTVSRGRAVLAGAAVVWLVEYGIAYPHPLAFFNTLVGGPDHGIDYLVDSNLDWGQDLKPLKAWMDRHRVGQIALAYFGTADPRYYGIACTYLNGVAPFVPRSAITAPDLPGYVAVSATVLQGVYFDEAHRDFYKPLLARTPVASIGHSIYVYWVEEPWWGGGSGWNE